MTTPLLQARDLRKTFGHVQAVRGIDLDISAGEVLSIVGDNGAGKSTLIKLLAGVYTPDAGGEILVNGEPQRWSGPKDALAAGIATVYQDLSLVDTRDVAANLFLGRELRRGPFVNRKRMIAESERVLQEFTFRLPSVKVPVSMLSGGQRQSVAIARVLLQGADLVILDEPTAALGVQESQKVVDVIARLRDAGKAVIVISHNIQQVWDVTDRFAALRLGRVAGIRDRASTTPDEIVRLIVYGE
jgi:ABC-type sugar transport system ATPase subunit